MTLHLRVPKYHCQECKRYFRHAFTGIRPRFRASEAYRLEVFEAHDGGVTQRKLSRTHQISPATELTYLVTDEYCGDSTYRYYPVFYKIIWEVFYKLAMDRMSVLMTFQS